MIPLQADLAALQKRLRMKVDDTDRRLELDLRGEMDLERSHLLHRLALLEVTWGRAEQVVGKKGTFHEHWRIQWRPELTISLIESSIYGNTVAGAATARAVELAAHASSLADIAVLIERVLLADLQEAVEPTVNKLQALSATSTDTGELAEALPPLAAVVRYGSRPSSVTEPSAERSPRGSSPYWMPSSRDCVSDCRGPVCPWMTTPLRQWRVASISSAELYGCLTPPRRLRNG